MKKIGNIICGIILVAIGVIFACNAVFDTNINIFFDGWWTLFIILPCAVGLFNGKAIKGNIIGIIIGVLLLLSCQGIIPRGLIWKLMLPAILIVVGLAIIFRDTMSTRFNKEIKRIKDKNAESAEHAATFSGLDLDFSNEKFTGAKLSAVFGGINCNIASAIIEEDIVIDADAIFGGIDIFVPSDVNVKVKSTAIFGGASKGRKADREGAPTVYVNATCLFGGVEIK